MNRYLKPGYKAMQNKRGWTDDDTVREVRILRRTLKERGFTRTAVYRNNLDNPFMADQARELLISMMAPSSSLEVESARRRESYRRLRRSKAA